jgi:dihydroorotate dehydrogenase (fumarate)
MDLTTNYLGLSLRNPVVASASPLSQSAAAVRALADAGVGAVVLHSLFEEQVRRQQALDLFVTEQHEEAFGEALSYFPSPAESGGGTAAYLHLVESAVASVDIPVIASLNGSTPGGWEGFARSMQDAGAAAIELNVYLVPGGPAVSGRDVEEWHLDILRGVKDAVDLPVAVKLSPYFSSVGHMAARLDDAGADGLVLFNRFLQPDVDVEAFSVEPGVTLSTPQEGRLPRTWIALLRHHVAGSLAATTGVETGEDVVKCLLAGADVVMTASALLRHGVQHAEVLLAGLQDWMTRKGYGSVDEFRGLLSVPVVTDAAQYERAGYVSALDRARRTYGDLRVADPGEVS